MYVFVTGATGFVGAAVIQELIGAGHTVLGLARTDQAAASVAAAGAKVHRGSIEDLDSLGRGAAASDGVIHTAFIHDFSKFAENCEKDRLAIEALGEALAGSDRPLLVTGGVAVARRGPVATEQDPHVPSSPAYPRASEEAMASVAARGVRASVVRLPQVHGDGDHAFVPRLIAIAREKGVSAYVGDGQNRWAAAHRFATPSLYRLALEQGVAGARFHAVEEEGIPLKAIAEAIGRGLKVPVISVPAGEAAAHFGALGFFATMSNPASSALTRQRLGWNPGTHPGLIDDLDNANEFAR